jgi:GNAT superfamily N-acetyltransferase
MADADTIARFNVLLAEESEGRALDPATVTRGVPLLLSDPDRARYWIAEADGGVQGQCAVTTEWSDWSAGRYWWLQSVYVTPEWRGKGVLRALWDRVVADARALGDVAAIRLYVDKDNTGARIAYTRLGMSESPYLVYEARLDESGGEAR